MPEERPRRTPHSSEQRNSKPSGWQLIAVQSISCVVVILIALLFKMIGGSAFKELRDSFNRSIMSNSIIATLAALIDPPKSKQTGDTSDTGTTTTAGGSTGTTQTDGTTAASGTGTTAASASGTSTSQAATQTTAASKSQTTSGIAAKTSATVAAGGHDIPVTQKKVLYAPEGATFARLKINRLAYKPLESGKVTSYFGYRESPTSGEEGFHQGLDVAAEAGSPIAAMYFGVIKEVGQNATLGNFVRIYHGNGIEVMYAHCSQILVNKDTVIKAGEVVAKVGTTGESTGYHVHIEVTLNGINYDPAFVVPMEEHA